MEREHRFRILLGDLLHRSMPVVWGVLGAGVVVALLRRLRREPCDLCASTGRLRLEVTPPGEMRFEVQVECPACKGLGRLSAIDR